MPAEFEVYIVFRVLVSDDEIHMEQRNQLYFIIFHIFLFSSYCLQPELTEGSKPTVKP